MTLPVRTIVRPGAARLSPLPNPSALARQELPAWIVVRRRLAQLPLRPVYRRWLQFTAKSVSHALGTGPRCSGLVITEEELMSASYPALTTVFVPRASIGAIRGSSTTTGPAATSPHSARTCATGESWRKCTHLAMRHPPTDHHLMEPWCHVDYDVDKLYSTNDTVPWRAAGACSHHEI